MNDALREYSEASVAGEGQLKLIIMLYEGTCRYLKAARESIKNKDIPEAHTNLVKAKRIIVHFLSTTSPESGELALNLHRLYIFLYEKIATANMRKSVDDIDDALRIVTKLLEGWRELEQQGASPALPLGETREEPASLSVRA